MMEYFRVLEEGRFDNTCLNRGREVDVKPSLPHLVDGIFEPPDDVVIGYIIYAQAASGEEGIAQRVAGSKELVLGIAEIAKGIEINRHRDGVEFLGRDVTPVHCGH